jgi:hypothetical protein
MAGVAQNCGLTGPGVCSAGSTLPPFHSIDLGLDVLTLGRP